MGRIISTLLLFTCLLTTAKADNWHRWRGPNADGSSATANPPVNWSLDQNVKWQVEIPGKGSSTPIVWEDSVLILSAIPVGAASVKTVAGPFGTNPKPTRPYQFVLLCYDRDSGRERWRSVATEQVPHEAGHLTNTYASSSPVTDGKRIFASFGSRGVYCFTFDGKLVWQSDLGDMETRREFGEASSPALHSDTLIVPWDHDGPSFIAALDANTGDLKWKTDRDELTTWATPIIVQHGGQAQVITNGTTVRSYDLETGQLIWHCGGQVSNPIPGPVVQDGVVYCMTGYRGNAIFAIPLDATGDVTDSPRIIWSRDDAAPYVSSPVLYKGRLYFTKGRSSIMTALDAESGQPIIEQQRLPSMQTMYASPVAASDRIYFTSREGVTVVIQHSEELKVLAINELEETIDASPAIVDDQMFLRGEKHLFCIEEEGS